MVNKDYWRNHWLFRKYEINDDMPLKEKVWRYQMNHKAFIMIECGILIIVLNWIKGIL